MFCCSTGQGTPLVNVMVLKPAGGAVFYKVLDTSGKAKNAEYIQKLHNDWADELTGKDRTKVLGVVMDGPAINIKAMRLLEQDNPTWLALCCSAHSLNLQCKDFGQAKRCPAIAAVLGTVQKVRAC